MFKKIFFYTILAVFFVFLSACGQETYTERFFAMDTYMDIHLSARSSDAAQRARDEIMSLDRLLAYQNQDSDAAQLNNTGSVISAGTDLLAVISDSVRYSQQTQGCFDITVQPLTSLWNISGGAEQIPDPADIAAAKALVDYRHIVIQNGDITLENGAQIDLGAIAKGYASDRAAQLLKENGVDSALLNLGGNIAAVGRKPDGGDWRVGIQNPFGAGYIGVVSANDQFIITSGDYQRFITVDGVKYHHILDPRTGLPANSGLASVTVVCGNGAMGDAYSTALFVMGLDEAMKLYSRQGNFEAVFVTTDKRVVVTDGLRSAFTFTGAEEGLVYAS